MSEGTINEERLHNGKRRYRVAWKRGIKIELVNPRKETWIKPKMKALGCGNEGSKEPGTKWAEELRKKTTNN